MCAHVISETCKQRVAGFRRWLTSVASFSAQLGVLIIQISSGCEECTQSMMISSRILSIIGFTVNYPGKFFLASAFSWCKSTLQLTTSPEAWRRWLLGSVITTLYFLFLVYGLAIHLLSFRSDRIFELTYHILFTLAYFTVMCDKVNYFRCISFYTPTLNGFFNYFQAFTESYLAKEKRRGRGILMVEMFLRMMIFNIFTAPILSLVQHARASTSSVYLTSLLVNHPTALKVLYPPIALFHAFLIGAMIAELMFNTTVTIIPIYYYTSIFSAFKYRNREENPLLSNAKHASRNLTNFVRVAQLVQTMYTRLLQGRILPIHFVISYFIVISLFCLIRFHEFITWDLQAMLVSGAATASLGWLIVMWFLGNYFTSAARFLSSWKNAHWASPAERRVMKKVIRSCRPIEFATLPRVLRFRPVTVIKYFNFISWALCKALIVFK